MLKLYGAHWLDKYKKALPRKHKKQLDEDVKTITKATFASGPADRFLKFITRATHGECGTFSSTHIECNFSVDFKELATSVLKIRHFYVHKPPYRVMAVRFQNDIA